MKKLLKFAVLFTIMMGWIYGFGAYMDYYSLNTQAVMVILLFAPITESLIFQETAYQMGKKWDCMAVAQILSAVIFGLVHQNHYFAFGIQYCILVQGMFAIILFQVRKETNLFWVMVMHSAWNATLLLIF